VIVSHASRHDGSVNRHYIDRSSHVARISEEDARQSTIVRRVTTSTRTSRQCIKPRGNRAGLTYCTFQDRGGAVPSARHAVTETNRSSALPRLSVGHPSRSISPTPSGVFRRSDRPNVRQPVTRCGRSEMEHLSDYSVGRSTGRSDWPDGCK